MNQLRWLGVTALVLALAACGGGSDGEAEAPPAGLAKLSQAAAAPSLVPQGKLLQAPRAAPTQSAPVAHGCGRRRRGTHRRRLF